MNSSSVVGIQSGEAESTTMPASRASPVVVVLDLIVAKQTYLVAALAWPEVLVSHVHVLHTEWAACHVTDASDLMSDGNTVIRRGDSQSPSSMVLLGREVAYG